MSEPLDQVTSIKVKLGLLVVASVLVATVLATLGAGAVPAWLGIPVTVMLALGVTQLLAVGMTAPLRQMTAAARRMATGDYAVRVDTTATDEVGELARAFNRMAADLATVDRQRRDLVATVSHELRTPLAGLVALLENLADGVTRPEPDTVRAALGQAERLGDLVDDLLDLSRIEAGAVPLDRAPVPLADLVAGAVDEARALPREVRYDVQVPADLEVQADRRRLHQLLANLLDNASRHSPTGGTVSVRAGHTDELVWLEVADQGPGIPPHAREEVFERFGRADTTSGGTGLGLAIARWVAELHGGRIRAVDPVTDSTGARLRVELPQHAAGQPARPAAAPTGAPNAAASARTTSAQQPGSSPMSRPMPVPESTVDAVLGRVWREDALSARPLVLLACVALGVFAGATLPFDPFGLATSVLLLGSGALVLTVSRRRDRPYTWVSAALCVALGLVPAFRAAEWLSVLSVLVAGGLVTTALVDARSVGGMVLGALSWPLSGLRGLPWLGRTVRAATSRGRGGASALVVARTVLLGVLAVVVFGALFASADAVFGRWVSRLVPDLGAEPVARGFLAVAVAGIVLAASYLALNPPDVERGRAPRPAPHRFEWLAPVLLVDAVFALFLAAQAAAFFGGHDYVQRTTGLTYAEYVHQGFAQLTLATMLMLVVVWAAARKARRDTAADRWWLRGSLGALCLLTLVVVGSALHRMDLYQDAYGFTLLRLLVDVFEGWLGLVVLGVLVAGFRLRAPWLPRAAVLSGAALLLGLAVLNPDAWVAEQNLDRYQATGKVDWHYLRSLSADAVPAIRAQPDEVATCALPDDVSRDGLEDGWTGWNLGRWRAADLLAEQDVTAATGADLAACMRLGGTETD